MAPRFSEDPFPLPCNRVRADSSHRKEAVNARAVAVLRCLPPFPRPLPPITILRNDVKGQLHVLSSRDEFWWGHVERMSDSRLAHDVSWVASAMLLGGKATPIGAPANALSNTLNISTATTATTATELSTAIKGPAIVVVEPANAEARDLRLRIATLEAKLAESEKSKKEIDQQKKDSLGRIVTASNDLEASDTRVNELQKDNDNLRLEIKHLRNARNTFQIPTNSGIAYPRHGQPVQQFLYISKGNKRQHDESFDAPLRRSRRHNHHQRSVHEKNDGISNSFDQRFL
jgi:hypothetical protein